MKQTLQLKLTQHLTLTPQLQQSIRLLQLSTLELNQELERFLADNPLLERDEGEEESSQGLRLNGTSPTTPQPAETQEKIGCLGKSDVLERDWYDHDGAERGDDKEDAADREE